MPQQAAWPGLARLKGGTAHSSSANTHTSAPTLVQPHSTTLAVLLATCCAHSLRHSTCTSPVPPVAQRAKHLAGPVVLCAGPAHKGGIKQRHEVDRQKLVGQGHLQGGSGAGAAVRWMPRMSRPGRLAVRLHHATTNTSTPPHTLQVAVLPTTVGTNRRRTPTTSAPRHCHQDLWQHGTAPHSHPCPRLHPPW
jgi:hypothetical protein